MSAAALTALIARCRALCRPRLQLDDTELLRRFAQQREAAAFAELLDRYAPLVWGVCRRMLPCDADCEDAFQATFLALVRKPGSIDPKQALGGWLHTVAERVARKMQAGSRRQRPQTVLPEHGSNGDVADEVGSRELFRIVDEEIERLPALVRLPLILCCLQGRTRDEAAAALGCSVAAVKSRLERGRALLRRSLERRGMQLPAAFLVLGLTSERIRAALWAKTMQSVLYTPAPAIAALAEAGVSAATIGKYKRILAVLLLVSGAAGVAGTLLTENPGEKQALPQTKSVGEEKRNETSQVRRDRHGDPLPDGAIARLGTVRWRHGSLVFAVAFSPDGRKIAAVGAGRDITLWDVGSGKEIRSFPNEGKQPVGVAFSPDGKLLATVSRGDAASIWSVDTGKRLRQVTRRNAGFSGLAFSPDGKTLATGGSSGTIYFWDPITGAEQRRIETKQSYLSTLAFSPDGKQLASGGSRGKGENDGLVILWDTRTGREEQRFKVQAKEVSRIAFSPDGKLLALSGWESAIRLLDAATGRQIRVLTEKMPLGGPFAFSPDSTLLAAGHPDGTIRLWDTAAGSEKRRWQAGSSLVFAIAYSPDGKTLASSAGSDIRLWDAATGQEKHHSEEHHGFVSFLRFSANGAGLVSIGNDWRILRWDVATNTPQQQFSWTGSRSHVFALSPDGTTLAVNTWPENELRLWDVRTGRRGRLLGKHRDWIRAIAFSPDGRLVASVGTAQVIHVWDAGNGKEVQQIKGLKNPVTHLCFSPDSKALACSMRQGANAPSEPGLHLWDLASGKERTSFDSPIPDSVLGLSLAFSPDGRVLASGAATNTREADMVRLWDTATGKELCRHTGHGETVVAIVFSPDGKLVASGAGALGNRDNSVHVWEAATGRLIRRFEGHHSCIGTIAFSPDGLTVASGAGDSTILLWDITGRRGDGHWHAKPLTPRQLEGCWAALTNEDAAKAYDAVWALVAAPEQAVPFLRKYLPPVQRPDAKTVSRHIADLDSANFAVRRKVTEELTKLGDVIAPALQQALDGKPSLEMRRRIQQVLDQSRDWTPLRLRDHRAIQALEHIGTRPAREALQAISAGAAAAHRTEAAKAAANRLR